MPGFFPVAVMEAAPEPPAPLCGACGLSRGCKSPRMPVTGEGRRKVLVIAEAPGETEDREGMQLVGRSGQLLRKFLAKVGMDLDRDCWKTNAVCCHPGKGGNPTERQVECCRPNVSKAIRELRPVVILLLGAAAVRSVVGPLWRRGEDVGPIGRWVGWQVPCRRPNVWLCPTWHPAYIGRERDDVLNLWFGRHLEAVFKLRGRPWADGPPDLEGVLCCEMDPEKAAEWLDGIKWGKVAVDYETNMLKPDHPDAQILSCAVCRESGETVAYPWVGRAVEATSRLLKSDVPKIGANIKFEERWTQRVLGHGIRNWLWDTMVAAHVLDNRPLITSVKFQSLVRLGISPYDAAVLPYIKSGGSNEPNRLDRVDMMELLTYNAMDAKCEWELAKLQMEEMGWKSGGR